MQVGRSDSCHRRQPFASLPSQHPTLSFAQRPGSNGVAAMVSCNKDPRVNEAVELALESHTPFRAAMKPCAHGYWHELKVSVGRNDWEHVGYVFVVVSLPAIHSLQLCLTHTPKQCWGPRGPGAAKRPKKCKVSFCALQLTEGRRLWLLQRLKSLNPAPGGQWQTEALLVTMIADLEGVTPDAPRLGDAARCGRGVVRAPPTKGNRGRPRNKKVEVVVLVYTAVSVSKSGL